MLSDEEVTEMTDYLRDLAAKEDRPMLAHAADMLDAFYGALWEADQENLAWRGAADEKKALEDTEDAIERASRPPSS